MGIVKQLALAFAACVAILVLAVVSDAALEIYLFRRDAQATGACVDAKGAWVNWPWPNVPTLSPACADAAAERAEKK